MEPISTGAYLGAMGISALGSALGGYSQAQAAKDAAKRQQQQAQQVLGQSYQQMGQNDRQFAQNSNLDRSKYLDQRALGAADIQRRINLTPIADQAAYGMRNMLGAAPAPFQPRDFTRGTMPGQGQASGGAAPMLAAQNAATQALHERVTARGDVMMTGCTVDGRLLARICVLSFRTRRRDIEIAIQQITEEAATLTRGTPSPA